MAGKKSQAAVQSYKHQDKRRNIPTEQGERNLSEEVRAAVRYAPDIRNPGGDPRLAWERRMPEEHVQWANPLFVNEKVHPSEFIKTLTASGGPSPEADLFADFNGLPEGAKCDWYKHDGDWSNRLIRGPAKDVMASFLGKEGMGGKVQMIYFDPPYGINYKSSVVADGRKAATGDAKEALPGSTAPLVAFQDDYKRGVHSYFDRLLEQLVLMRDLLKTEGSLFLQIGKANVHRVACILDEVFGAENRVATISYATSGGSSSKMLSEVADYILWYAKDKESATYHPYLQEIEGGRKGIMEKMTRFAIMLEMPDGTCRKLTNQEWDDPTELPQDARLYRRVNVCSQSESTTETGEPFTFNGRLHYPIEGNHWRVKQHGLQRLAELGRLCDMDGKGTLHRKRYENEYAGTAIGNVWASQSAQRSKDYVVQTASSVVERCMLMATDPGDLVLDPTCGSGTTAYVAEKWGRRWITVDCGTVGVNVARHRIMAGVYPYHLLRDSEEGAMASKGYGQEPIAPSAGGWGQDVRKGFVCRAIDHPTAETLAYDLQPEKDVLTWDTAKQRGIWRCASSFTVETHNSYRSEIISPDEVLKKAPEGPSQKHILKALDEVGLPRENGSMASITDVKPLISSDASGSKREIITHTCMLEDRLAGLVVAPDDCTVSTLFVERAALSARKIFGLKDVIIVGFAFDSCESRVRTERRSGLQIHHVLANQDLRINELKNDGKTRPFALVGEPDLELKKTDDGQLTVTVDGFESFDPVEGVPVSGEADHVACWMIDTDHDNRSLFVRRIHFPGQLKNTKSGAGKHLKNLRKKIDKTLDQEQWDALDTLTSAPFPMPKSGFIAVRIITHTHTEMTAVLDVEQQLSM